MPQLAIVKLPKFVKKETFAEVDEKMISSQLQCRVAFREFTGTADMYLINKIVFGRVAIEIVNAFYNDKYLIQTFHTEDESDHLHENIIVVKRLIQENDTYTFTEFDPKDPSSDKYQYCDVTESDVVSIVRRRNVISAIVAKSDGSVKNEEIIVLKDEIDMGKILVKSENKEIVYLNLSNVVNGNQTMTQDGLDRHVQEKINAYCADYFFVQLTLGFCLLNCYYRSFGTDKNELLSRILEHDVYGDAIIFLQSCANDDFDTILHVDESLFRKICKLVTGEKKVKPKNKHFFNACYELRDV